MIVELVRFVTTLAVTSPPRCIAPITLVLFVPRPLLLGGGTLPSLSLRLRGRPPMKVSSASMIPLRSLESFRAISFRIRCSMYSAVGRVRSKFLANWEA